MSICVCFHSNCYFSCLGLGRTQRSLWLIIKTAACPGNILSFGFFNWWTNRTLNGPLWVIGLCDISPVSMQCTVDFVYEKWMSSVGRPRVCVGSCTSFIPLSLLVVPTFIIHDYYTSMFFIFYGLGWLSIYQQLLSSVGLLPMWIFYVWRWRVRWLHHIKCCHSYDKL